MIHLERSTRLSNDNVIKELEFVLTHPSCNVEHLERFYNDLLYINDAVPIFQIVSYMKKRAPEMLKVWSIQNKVIGKLLVELNSDVQEEKDSKDKYIEIEIKARELLSTSVKTYVYQWRTDLDSSHIERCFKEQRIKVICHDIANLSIIGNKQEQIGVYTLHLKQRRG